MFRVNRPAARIRASLSWILCPAIALAVAPFSAFAQSPRTAAIQAVIDAVIKADHVKGIIVQVRCGGQNLYLKAAGESMTRVPVTTNMHFRNGAMAFTYMSTMLLELVDQHPELVSLNDKLAKFLPQIPNAENVTLKELVNMTSGYQDYVYEPEVTTGLYRNPFRQWTPEELIQIGVTPGIWFDPGKKLGLFPHQLRHPRPGPREDHRHAPIRGDAEIHHRPHAPEPDAKHRDSANPRARHAFLHLRTPGISAGSRRRTLL